MYVRNIRSKEEMIFLVPQEPKSWWFFAAWVTLSAQCGGFWFLRRSPCFDKDRLRV